ncbi:MAG: Rnase Y domain-containing protein, partial [Rubrobacter sp.]|nr:Rnase Y domain-containing protein [Rubrobacter sp.]
MTVAISLAALALGFAVGLLAFRRLAERKQSEARSDAHSIREEADNEARRITESARREAELSAKEESLKIKAEAEEEARARRTELARY